MTPAYSRSARALLGKRIFELLKRSRRYLGTLLLSMSLLAVAGCSSITYYSQSVIGHSKLMLARKPITSILKDASPELAEQLKLAQNLRQFSVTELGLPDNGSYSSYVDLDRDFPVWTVVAAPEFSVKPKTWCYLVIGCASYRGYFSKQAALDYAESLKQQGFEVTVGGASAYSTLGWFNDPLVPSMMRYGTEDFAETLFHELAHQQLYLDGDSAFNEAFATVVGEQGAIIWLQDNRPELVDNYVKRLAARDEFNLLLSGFKQRLNQLYADETIPEAEMRASKAQMFLAFSQQYQQLKTNRWQGRDRFGHWFEQPFNNARLAAFATYRDKSPAFNSLLADCDRNFLRFYSSLSSLKGSLSSGQAEYTVPSNCAKSAV